MTSERNPRRDPAAGDRLRKPGMERVVNYCEENKVDFIECRRGGVIRLAVVSIGSWRRWATAAEVLGADCR